MVVSELNSLIQPFDSEICKKAWEKWDNIAKPLRSLGKLEEMVVKLAGIQNTINPKVDKKAVAVFCSDNGVVEENVTQCGNDVTAIVSRNFVLGKTTLNSFAETCGADVFPIDVGIASDMKESGIIDLKIAYGTKNIAKGSAMTEKEFEKALFTGVETVRKLKEKGYNMIVTGEMGIGNTTTSSALLSVFENVSVSEVTGKGAGLSDSSLKHKIAVIEKAIEVNKPDRNNVAEVMTKLGGFDICAMAGCFIGGGIYRVPIIIDGFISAVSALCAVKLAENCRNYMFASHCSAEPAGKFVLEKLGLEAVLNCDMRLGEGTGAVIGAKLFDFALSAYNEMSSFDEINVKKYQFL